MIPFRLTSVSTIFIVIGALFCAIGLAVSAFFWFSPSMMTAPSGIVIVDATTTPPVVVEATSTPIVKPTPQPVIPPKKPPVIVPPPVVVTPPPVVPPPVKPPPHGTVGTTTLAIKSIPLLSGGTVHAGKSVPIMYLQIENVGNEGAVLTGFWVKQNGNAPGEAVIGLTTVDDKGGSRGVAGNKEGETPFQSGIALAPTDAYFAPGQTRLFTIKAHVTRLATPYIGMSLMLDVTSIETTATVQGQFPITGTTWTIAP